SNLTSRVSDEDCFSGVAYRPPLPEGRSNGCSSLLGSCPSERCTHRVPGHHRYTPSRWCLGAQTFEDSLRCVSVNEFAILVHVVCESFATKSGDLSVLGSRRGAEMVFWLVTSAHVPFCTASVGDPNKPPMPHCVAKRLQEMSFRPSTFLQ
nr:hypothetical protein [Tanacetum cinerariifolium]